MFSCTVNNPNQFIIKTDNFIPIPFGHRCTSGLACKYANIRKFSLPFDWTIPLFPSKIKKVLENDFQDFIPDVHNKVFKNIYDFELVHFNPDTDKGIEEYKRRIHRFQEIMKSTTKIYFIYMNEDYLFDKEYRVDEFNDKIFNEMLDLEVFLKEKYPHLDFNILYFNFKSHDVPANSNIINFILHTPNVYDDGANAPYEMLRSYYGYLLSQLFNTPLTCGYSEETFYY